jgi:hypothetical protein
MIGGPRDGECVGLQDTFVTANCDPSDSDRVPMRNAMKRELFRCRLRRKNSGFVRLAFLGLSTVLGN